MFFNERSETLRIEVVNEPGEGHDRLVRMGKEACAAVFQQSTRLHEDNERNDNILSSGDGAWIMQKCAKNLGGFCEIAFEPTRTKFAVECHASPVFESDDSRRTVFELPSNRWAIGVDDSWIQRKLLLRKLLSGR